VGWMLMSTLSDDKLDNIIRRANIATEKASDRVKVPEMIDRIRDVREKGYCSVENIPFLSGATIAVLLPVTIQNQPVAIGLGGAAERIRVNHDRYLAILQRAVKAMRPDDPFEQPIDIEF
jgi:DNA-binding IclR family transcriptional regulator